MPRIHRIRILTLVAATLCLLLLPIFATAQPSGKKEHAFRGKVEKVDAKAKTLTVNGENVPGWMAPMTMSYAVDKEDVLAKVKAGDTITAKVYDGDVKTLYDVQVATAEKK
jgi:Cu/Ag efflux protein CusF